MDTQKANGLDRDIITRVRRSLIGQAAQDEEDEDTIGCRKTKANRDIPWCETAASLTAW